MNIHMNMPATPPIIVLVTPVIYTTVIDYYFVYLHVVTAPLKGHATISPLIQIGSCYRKKFNWLQFSYCVHALGSQRCESYSWSTGELVAAEAIPVATWSYIKCISTFWSINWSFILVPLYPMWLLSRIAELGCRQERRVWVIRLELHKNISYGIGIQILI